MKKQKSLYGCVSDMDIHLLRVFRTVVECGGFSAAEVELNIGRSAISRYMKDLETRLDLRLCARGRSGFALTDHGRLVYDAALRLLADLEHFRDTINAAHGRLVGTLTLSLTDDIVTDARSRVGDALARFRERGPDVKIALTVASPNEIEREVIERRTQVGVVPLHRRLPALNYHPLYEETLFLYCSASHPLARQTTPPDLELVRAQDFVVPGYTLNETFQEFFPNKTPAARTNKMEGVATLILSGKFIGFMPDHFANRWVESGQMHTLLADRLQVSIPFAAITHRDVQPSLLRDTFLADMLAAHALGAPDGS